MMNPSYYVTKLSKYRQGSSACSEKFVSIRQGSACILETWAQGRKKHIWLSAHADLSFDASGDLADINAKHIKAQPLKDLRYLFTYGSIGKFEGVILAPILHIHWRVRRVRVDSCKWCNGVAKISMAVSFLVSELEVFSAELFYCSLVYICISMNVFMYVCIYVEELQANFPTLASSTAAPQVISIHVISFSFYQ